MDTKKNKANHTIRKYQPSDIDACRSLWVELTQRHRHIYNDPTIGGDNPGLIFDDYVKNEKLHGPWVVVVNEKIVGFTGLLVEGDEADIEPMIVSEEYRNKGIGERLIEYVVEEAKLLQIRFLGLKPVARNIEAISFFVRSGFNIAGQVELFQDLRKDSQREWKTGIGFHGNELKY